MAPPRSLRRYSMPVDLPSLPFRTTRHAVASMISPCIALTARGTYCGEFPRPALSLEGCKGQLQTESASFPRHRCLLLQANARRVTPPTPVVGPDEELEALKVVVARAKAAYEVSPEYHCASGTCNELRLVSDPYRSRCDLTLAVPIRACRSIRTSHKKRFVPASATLPLWQRTRADAPAPIHFSLQPFRHAKR